MDARNDSQVLFYDQVIQGSALVGSLNADQRAMTVPIARSHATLGASLVNHNDFPRACCSVRYRALPRRIWRIMWGDGASPIRRREAARSAVTTIPSRGRACHGTA